MARKNNFESEYIKIKIDDFDIYLISMDVKDLVKIGYVAERGISEERAAVQRILNKNRVKDIKEFVQKGGRFYSPFILNWNNEKKPLSELKTKKISIPLVAGSAQLIDGQHRYMGLQNAIEDDNKFKGFNVVVMLSNNLSTKDAANIFVSINSKQQTVSKSLIYDLYKELDENPESIINRAVDIADALNTEEESPYKGFVVYPGKRAPSAKIQLSTVVNSLESHLGNKGTFAKYNFKSLSYQKALVVNFSKAVALQYEEEGLWNSYSKNPFITSAGFRAVVEAMTSESFLQKVVQRKSLSVENISSILSLNKSDLFLKDENYKKLGGKEQVKSLKEYLLKGLLTEIPEETEYEL